MCAFMGLAAAGLCLAALHNSAALKPLAAMNALTFGLKQMNCT